MRFNWLEAACVVVIAIMMLELHPVERTARLFADASAWNSAGKSGLVADNAARRPRDDNRQDRR